jgi:VIT1/CCC1 family predicted Fe2+/Mn2+ transporter
VLALERHELHRNPGHETRELELLYQSRGVDPEQARGMAESVMSDPELALQTHAREELGIDPDELGSPVGAATSSFVAFAVGAFVPLLPWFLGGGGGAILASLALALTTAVALGVVIAKATDRTIAAAVTRQVALTAIPAALTYAIGSLVGTAV